MESHLPEREQVHCYWGTEEREEEILGIAESPNPGSASDQDFQITNVCSLEEEINDPEILLVDGNYKI